MSIVIGLGGSGSGRRMSRRAFGRGYGCGLEDAWPTSLPPALCGERPVRQVLLLSIIPPEFQSSLETTND